MAKFHDEYFIILRCIANAKDILYIHILIRNAWSFVRDPHIDNDFIVGCDMMLENEVYNFDADNLCSKEEMISRIDKLRNITKEYFEEAIEQLSEKSEHIEYKDEWENGKATSIAFTFMGTSYSVFPKSST